MIAVHGEHACILRAPAFQGSFISVRAPSRFLHVRRTAAGALRAIGPRIGHGRPSARLTSEAFVSQRPAEEDGRRRFEDQRPCHLSGSRGTMGDMQEPEVAIPAVTPKAEIIEDAVILACRAPSLHNSQPWRWVAERGALQLFLDPTRVLDYDQSRREALIGCGAALHHLRVAMAAGGWHTKTNRFPKPEHPDHIASLELHPDEPCHRR